MQQKSVPVPNVSTGAMNLCYLLLFLSIFYLLFPLFYSPSSSAVVPSLIYIFFYVSFTKHPTSIHLPPFFLPFLFVNELFQWQAWSRVGYQALNLSIFSLRSRLFLCIRKAIFHFLHDHSSLYFRTTTQNLLSVFPINAVVNHIFLVFFLVLVSSHAVLVRRIKPFDKS